MPDPITGSIQDEAGGIPSNLTGVVPPGYSPAYGGAPLIPDPIASMWQAIGGDAASMPSLTNLANIYNLFNYNQQAGQVAGTPGFDSVLSNLHGQLPQDVIDELSQSAAERGIGSGQLFGDSPNANAAYLRALGTNSLALQNRGQEQYGALLGHFPKPADLDMSQFFVSPEAQQAANAAANVSAAAPNPKQAADEEFRKLLESIAAGKAGVPSGAGGVPSVVLPGAGGSGGTHSGPSGTMVGGALNRGGTNPNLWMPSPANLTLPVNSSGRPLDATQTASPQSPLDQLVQSLQGKGPTYGMPWPGGGVMASDTAGSDWWNRSDPWGGLSSIDWAAPNLTSGGEGGGQIGSTSPGSDWWNSTDPWDALSNIDWGAPAEQGSTGAGSDWWNAPDPMDALSQIDWGLPSQQEQIPDWAGMPYEDVGVGGYGDRGGDYFGGD